MSDSDSDSDFNNRKKRLRRDSSDPEDSAGEDVEAEFLFKDPCSDDFDGVMNLVQGFMKKFDWTLPPDLKKDRYCYLSELVSNQPNVGTLIKVEDQEDSYIMAVLSLLNLNQFDGLNTFKDELVKKAKEHCEKNEAQKLEDVLMNKKNQVGLLVNERMGNIPSQLVGNLHESLKEDIKWSKENVEDEEEEKYYNFTHLVGMSRLYCDNPKNLRDNPNLVYHKPEEKYYLDNSLVKFTWPTGESTKVHFYEEDERNTSKILKEHMFVFCLTFDKYNLVVKEISKKFKE